MKQRRPILATIALVSALAVSALTAQAQVYTNAYWDTDTNSSGTGGTGTWSSTGTNWNTNSLGGAGNFAVTSATNGGSPTNSGNFIFNFGGTAGTISQAGNMNFVGGINFLSGGYIWNFTGTRTINANSANATNILGGLAIYITNDANLTISGTSANGGLTLGAIGIAGGSGATLTLSNAVGSTNYIVFATNSTAPAAVRTNSVNTIVIGAGDFTIANTAGNSTDFVQSGNITNNSTGVLMISNNTSGNWINSGAVSGLGSLTLRWGASGNIILGASNNYSGGTVLTNSSSSSGYVGISNASAFGTNSLTVAGAATNYIRALVNALDISNNVSINSGSTLRLATANSSHKLTWSGGLSGSGGVYYAYADSGLYLTATNNSFGGGFKFGSSGSLYVSQLGLAGSNSPIGTNGAISWVSDAANSGAGLLRWTGTNNEASDKNFVMAGTSTNSPGMSVMNDGTNATLTLNGSISTTAGTTNQRVALSSRGTNTLILNGQIIEAAGVTNSLLVGSSQTGTVVLNHQSNNISGGVTITNPTASTVTTLSVSKIGNAGEAGSLGTNGTINIGNASSSSTCALVYTGTGETNNKAFNLITTNGTLLLDQSGTGNLKFTGAITSGTNGSRTNKLQGSTAGTGELASDIGDLGGVMSVTKSGTGTWTLSGSNSYSGLTTISGSTNAVLKFASANSLSPNTSLAGSSSTGTTATIELSTAGNYVLNSYGTTNTAGNNISFTALQPGTTLTFTNATNTVTSSGAGSAGRSILNNSTNLSMTFNGAIDIGSSATNEAEFGAVGDITVNGSIFNTNTGVRGLTKSGNGVLSLNASNSYNGTTAVNAGTLRLGNANALGTTSAGTVVASGAAIDLNGQTIVGEALNIEGSGINTNGALYNSSSAAASWTGGVSLTNDATIGVTNGSITISGNISETSSGKNLTKVGAGTLLLSGSNSYSGLTTMNGGTIQVSSPNALAAASALAGSGSANITNVLRLAATGSYTMDSVQVPGLMMIEGPGSGSTTLTFTNGGSMSGNSDKTISAGSGVTINVNGASFDTGNPGSGIRDLGISGAGKVIFNAAIVSTNGSTVNATRLLKEGAGTVTLNGANTYVGSTVISGGTLELGTAGSLRFVVGASGVNNAVSGAGAALFQGTFNLDLSAAGTNAGNTWSLVTVTSPSYLGSFQVAGFTNSGGTWTCGTNGVTYQFVQTTGILSVAGSAPVSAYNSWLTNYPSLGVNTNGAADPDADGFNNDMEFAFDGNPTVGSPALITAVNSGTNALFSFIASTNTNAVAYMVQSTTNLSTGPWADSSAVTATITNSTNQNNVLLSPSYVRREFSVAATNKSFYRVRATIAP